MRWSLLLVVGCTLGDPTPGKSPPVVDPPGEDPATDLPTDTDTDLDCELGLPCNPIPVTGLPFTDARDTLDAPASDVDAYACAPTTDESGGEFWYAVDVSKPGVLTATVTDPSGVDVDVHLLSAKDADSCVARAHEEMAWVVTPGKWFVVIDTWVDGGGTAQAGAYTLDLGFVRTTGDCAMTKDDLRMFWSDCDPGIDCDDSGADVLLHLPSAGPVVKEAHLVTTAETFGGNGWPTDWYDGISNHYAISQAASGFSGARTEPWAPSGEGGSEYGQGATGAQVPPLDEAWYVNMYWRNRPAKGTRMIVLNPFNGRAVVTSAGYETGPGSNEAIGGAVEEVHLHLGSVHRDTLVMGFAANQSLPLGPLTCP